MAKAAAIFFALLSAALLGYIFATQTDEEPMAPAPQPAGAPLRAEQSASDPVDTPFAVPLELRGLPTEWVSAASGDDHKGHAALLDLEGRRELIIEACEHRGYFDTAAGEPRPEDWSFCEPVVWGRVLAIEPGALVVRSRDGSELDASIEVSRAEDGPRIALTISDRNLDLVPGSKNDLYQRMDQTDPIRAEAERRDRYVAEQMSQAAERREAAANAAEEGEPRPR
jgi:hypothetical protein